MAYRNISRAKGRGNKEQVLFYIRLSEKAFLIGDRDLKNVKEQAW